MAEEEKSQKLVETHKAVAAGIASVVAAVFTSKLGVAGTLIGTALTATMITLASAILKAQLEKATHKVVGLPNTVRGRFSTQQIRIPGKSNPEPNPEPAAQAEADDRSPGLFSRLRAIPSFLEELPSAQRRKVLLAGLLAGLVATVIGLGSVTGIELIGGKTLSCLVWTCPDDSAESSGSSGLSIFAGSSPTQTQDTPTNDSSGGQQVTPGDEQQAPQRQRNGQPVQPGAANEMPQKSEDPAQPGSNSKAGEPVEPAH